MCSMTTTENLLKNWRNLLSHISTRRCSCRSRYSNWWAKSNRVNKRTNKTKMMIIRMDMLMTSCKTKRYSNKFKTRCWPSKVLKRTNSVNKIKRTSMNWVLNQSLFRSYKSSATVKTENSWYNRSHSQIWSNSSNWLNNFKELKIHNKILLLMILKKKCKTRMIWKMKIWKLGLTNFWNSLRNKLEINHKHREMMKLSLKILKNRMIKWLCHHLRIQRHRSRRWIRFYHSQKLSRHLFLVPNNLWIVPNRYSGSNRSKHRSKSTSSKSSNQNTINSSWKPLPTLKKQEKKKEHPL